MERAGPGEGIMEYFLGAGRKRVVERARKRENHGRPWICSSHRLPFAVEHSRVRNHCIMKATKKGRRERDAP